MATYSTATTTPWWLLTINTGVTRFLPCHRTFTHVCLAAFTQSNQQQACFKQARSTLQRGKSANLLAQMQALNEKMRGERRSIMTKEIQYFSKFHQQGYLSYSQVAAMNMPIGSGAIESLIRQVVNLRLKGNGKFWLLENAPQYCTLAVTGLRAIGQLFVILF